MILILQNENKKFKSIIIAVIFIVLLFSQTGKVDAADPGCQYALTSEMGSGVRFLKLDAAQGITAANCCNKVKELFGQTSHCRPVDANGTMGQAENKSVLASGKEAAADFAKGPLEDAFIWLLTELRAFLGWLLSLAAILFEFVVDPGTMSGTATNPNGGLLNSDAVREIWVMTRDFLNMFFILILLFSAFGTIFQVSKYNVKKVWLTLVLNALLVNFSYPIARFIIDISNVTMYYFLNNMFIGATANSGASILANIGNYSMLHGINNPNNFSEHQIAYLIASCIFIFIFGITLLVLAAMFLIRLISLAMLVMFSPIGFVGYIFPGTSGYATKWWNNLFKYSFFGPIMVFVMLVALKLMETISQDHIRSIMAKSAVQGVSQDQTTWFAQIALYTIPIMILWMGMGIAQSIGIEGASVVVGKGKKFANATKGFIWKNTGGKAWGGIKKAPGAAWKSTGIPGGLKQTTDYYKKRGVKLPFASTRIGGSDQREDKEARIAGKFGVPNAVQNNMLKRMDEFKKEMNLGDLDKTALNSLYEKSSAVQKLAIAQQLAENGQITETQLAWAMKNFDKTPMAKRILDKAKDKTPHLAMDYITDEKDRQKLVKNFKAENLNEGILSNDKFMKEYISVGKMDKKALDGLTQKEKETYTKTIEKIADNLGPDATKTSDAAIKNIQTQHFTLTGKIHTSIASTMSPAQTKAREAIWASLDKDNAGKIDGAAISSYSSEIVKNMNRGKVGEIAKAMKNETEAKLLIKTMLANHPETKKLVAKDPYLSMLSA